MDEVILKRENFLKEKNKCIEEWVNTQLNTFKGSSKDVLEFIANILYQQGDENSETIRFLFHAGYCYYFAKMLEDAFGGEASWHKGFSHIVWKDTREGEGQNIFYDIEGVFYDYNDDSDFVPLETLGSSLESFRHRGMDGNISKEISNFAKENNITEEKLIEIVYDMIPEKERIVNHCNKGDVTRVWDKYKDKLVIPKKENSLEEYIFTFGSGQEMEGYCVRVIGKNYSSCRTLMVKQFGTEWSFQYPISEWKEWTKKAKTMGIPVEEEILILKEE